MIYATPPVYDLRAPSLIQIPAGQWIRNQHSYLESPSRVEFSPFLLQRVVSAVASTLSSLGSFAASLIGGTRVPQPESVAPKPLSLRDVNGSQSEPVILQALSLSENLTNREWQILQSVARCIELPEARSQVERVVERAKKEQRAFKIHHTTLDSARSLYVTAGGNVHVKFSRKRQGDVLLGKGRSKNFYKAPELVFGSAASSAIRVAAYCSVKRERGRLNAADANRAEFEAASVFWGKVDPNSFYPGFVKDAWLDELMEGDLVDAFEGDRINFSSLEVRRDIAIQLATQIVEMHQRGFLHRDIKPENVLYSFDSNGSLSIQLTDLGFMIPKGQIPREVCGSPMYCSPEAIAEGSRGKPEGKFPITYATEQNDGWQLGSTLLGLYFDHLDPQFLQANPKLGEWLGSAHLEEQLRFWLYTNWISAPLLQEEWIKAPQDESSMEYVLFKLLTIDPAQRWTPAEALEALARIPTSN